jgi:hypothetical protein
MDSNEFASFKLLFGFFAFENVLIKFDFTRYWIAFHFVCAIVQLFGILKFWNLVAFTSDPVSETFDIIKVTSSFFAYFTAILMSWRRMKVSQEKSFEMKKIENLMKKLYVNVDNVQRNFHQSYKRKFLILSCFLFYSYVQEILIKKDIQKRRYIAALSFARFFSVFKTFHGIYCIELTNHYFSVLNNQLLHLQDLIKINETNLRNKNYSSSFAEVFVKL